MSERPKKNATGRYDNVDFRKGVGHKLPPIKVSYNRRDVLIFANSIGIPRSSLHYLYELHPQFAAFPTFPSNLIFKQTDQDVFDFFAKMVPTDSTANAIPGVPPFDPQRSVDGERGIEILKSIPVSSEGLDLELRGVVKGVWDKGGNMILEQEMVLIDALKSTPYAKLTSTAFGIGQGGYGGPKGPTIKLSPPPSRNPDYIHNHHTTEGQALLYRLNGDYNPMHASEEYGKQAGFKGSILQGLGTWNIVAHGVLEKVGGSDEKRFRSFGARFKSVVYPGDELETKIWVTGEEEGCEVCVFETRVKSDGRVALSNGTAKILTASVSSKL